MARVTASSGGRKVTEKTVRDKKPKAWKVPVREIDTMESIATGFRVGMIEIEDDRVKASIETGSGVGSEYITLTVNDRKFVIRGSELLRRAVLEVDPEAAEHFPDDVKVVEDE